MQARVENTLGATATLVSEQKETNLAEETMNNDSVITEKELLCTR